MATPPFDIAQTTPADSDIISQYPNVERTFRDVVESWLNILSDPATGLLRGSAITVPLTLTQAAAGEILRVVSTDAGAATGPSFILHRNSASPAAADNIGQIQFNGEDSAGNDTVYAVWLATILDATNGSEDASLRGYISIAGTLTERLTITTTGTNILGITDVAELEAGVAAAQSDANIRNRGVPNSFEWGHANPAGFNNTLGYGTSNGRGFLAFHGEQGTNVNTYRTRGRLASIIEADAASGGFNFGTVALATGDNQVISIQATISAAGEIAASGSLAGPFVRGTNVGSAAAPTLRTGNTTTGLYGSVSLEFAVSGVNKASLSSAGNFQTTGGYIGTTGTFSGAIVGTTIDLSTRIETPEVRLESANGIILWEDETDMWIRRLSAGVMQFVTAGIQRGVFNTTGLDVNGSLTASSTISTSGGHIEAGGTVFKGSATQVILSTLGPINDAGTIYLRPNGYNDADNQMTIDASGNATINGTLTVTG